jgi:hypothetical protein
VSRLTASLVVAVALGGACAVSAAARSGQAPARVVDQTYLCNVAVHNGVRRIETRAQRGFREGARWRWLASFSVGNENGGPPAKIPTSTGQVAIWYTNWSFGASAGLDLAHPEPSPPLQPYRAGVSTTPRRACTASRARVPLARRGLDGFPADYFGDEAECVAPAKVLVRVRTVFVQPASLQIDRSRGELRTRRASGAVREAAVAVQTTSGRPLVYATAKAAGAAHLYTAGSCTAT